MSPNQSLLPRTGLAPLIAGLDLPAGEIQLPNGSVIPVGGAGSPSWRIVFRSERALRTPMTELGVGTAFIKGDIDIEGDINILFKARQTVPDKMPFRQKLQFVYDYARTATKMNAEAVGEHYGNGDDFYHTFLDKRFRLYTQGIFQGPEDTIEQASEHKLEIMFAGLGLRKGMRLLDIGGGWGAVTKYCGARGVHVTTLTLTNDSAQYIRRLIQEGNLPGEVLVQDFLEYKPKQPFDHAVTWGVIEHITNYRKFADRVWKVVKPGGRLYLDGSAAVEKYAVSSFTRKYIWRGTHTFMTVQDVMAELLYHGFEMVEVKRETRDYELTMLEWAKRLDAARESIIAGWGEETYRVFRVFLWGGTNAFRTNALQAYHLIAERRVDAGPRPSNIRRIVQFLGNLG